MSDAICVGEYVADELAYRGWTYEAAVSCLDGDPAVNAMWLKLLCCVELWLSNDVKFGPDEATRLERIFGVSARTWININDQFQKAIARGQR